jgi:hypothetical protein
MWCPWDVCLAPPRRCLRRAFGMSVSRLRSGACVVPAPVSPVWCLNRSSGMAARLADRSRPRPHKTLTSPPTRPPTRPQAYRPASESGGVVSAASREPLDASCGFNASASLASLATSPAAPLSGAALPQGLRVRRPSGNRLQTEAMMQVGRVGVG